MASRVGKVQARPTHCPKCKAPLRTRRALEDFNDPTSRMLTFLKCPNQSIRKPIMTKVHHPVTGAIKEHVTGYEEKQKGRDLICNWVDPLFLAHKRKQ